VNALDTWMDQPVVTHRLEPLRFDLPDLIDLSERMATVEGFVPKNLLNRPPAILATMLAGRELGIDPLVSLRTIFVIEGRVALSAEIARALVYAAGHKIEVVTYDDGEVTVRGRRRDESNWTPISWTWDKAKRAGLTGRQNWTRYPRQMLGARATGELARLKFSDALAGLNVVADEEMAELIGGEPVEPEPDRPKATRTRRAAVKAAALPSAPTATDTPLVPVEQESVVEGSLVPSEDVGLAGAPPPTEPEPEAEVRPLREVASPPSDSPPASLLPQWQRRLHARVGEVFSGADQDTRDAYRHAIVALVTRKREDGSGPVSSSSELSEAERMGFDAVLNDVERGACLIARLESGAVEIRKEGWCYRVKFDPLEVKAFREAG
jgi:hypothetical protein